MGVDLILRTVNSVLFLIRRVQRKLSTGIFGNSLDSETTIEYNVIQSNIINNTLINLMVDELRAIFEILGNTTLQLGEYALWAGGGYVFYKLATLASYLFLAKYIVTSLFNYLNNRQVRIKEGNQNIKTGDMVLFASKNLIVSKTYKTGDDLMLLVDSQKWHTQEGIARYCQVVKASDVELIG